MHPGKNTFPKEKKILEFQKCEKKQRLDLSGDKTIKTKTILHVAEGAACGQCMFTPRRLTIDGYLADWCHGKFVTYLNYQDCLCSTC